MTATCTYADPVGDEYHVTAFGRDYVLTLDELGCAIGACLARTRSGAAAIERSIGILVGTLDEPQRMLDGILSELRERDARAWIDELDRDPLYWTQPDEEVDA